MKPVFLNALLIGFGDFAGTVLRYALGGLVHRCFPLATSRLHTAKILRLSTDLPIAIEIVDTEEKIQAFLPCIDHAIKEGAQEE